MGLSFSPALDPEPFTLNVRCGDPSAQSKATESYNPSADAEDLQDLTVLNSPRVLTSFYSLDGVRDSSTHGVH